MSGDGDSDGCVWSQTRYACRPGQPVVGHVHGSTVGSSRVPATSLWSVLLIGAYCRGPPRHGGLPPAWPWPSGPWGSQRSRRSRAVSKDRFCVRECPQRLMLSLLYPELLRVVHLRPLASVSVSGDRYSVGYLPSASWPGLSEFCSSLVTLDSLGCSAARAFERRTLCAVFCWASTVFT